VRERAFSPKQKAAELVLEFSDRPAQLGLGDIALFGGAREIECPRDGEKIPDLVHFHGRKDLEREDPNGSDSPISTKNYNSDQTCSLSNFVRIGTA